MQRTIIVAMDASEGAASALPAAEDLARRDGARLVLAHARTHVLETALEASLESRIEDMRRRGLTADLLIRTELAGHEADMLAQVAEEQHADLIVIAGRGRSAMKGAMLGSVTQRLLHLSGCQVLVVPAAATVPSPG
jgi:nucleotide-binding universal stress UspA family protein